MAMTRPKSSQVEHRGETVQKVIDDITQQDGVLSTEPSWTDVPKFRGANANKQAQALANRTEWLFNKTAPFISFSSAGILNNGSDQTDKIMEILGEASGKILIIGGGEFGVSRPISFPSNCTVLCSAGARFKILSSPSGDQTYTPAVQVGSDSWVNVLNVHLAAGVTKVRTIVELVGNSSVGSCKVSATDYNNNRHTSGTSTQGFGAMLFSGENIRLGEFVSENTESGMFFRNSRNVVVGSVCMRDIVTGIYGYGSSDVHVMKAMIFGPVDSTKPNAFRRGVMTPGANGLLLDGVSDSSFSNLYFFNILEHGVRLGVKFPGTSIPNHKVTFNNVNIYRPYGCGFKCDDGDIFDIKHIQVNGLYTEDVGAGNWFGTPGYQNWQTGGVNNPTLNNDGNKYGCALRNVQYGTLVNYVNRRRLANASGKYGLWVERSNEITVNGVDVSNALEAGLVIQDGSGRDMNNISIRGVTARYNGTHGVWYRPVATNQSWRGVVVTGIDASNNGGDDVRVDSRSDGTSQFVTTTSRVEGYVANSVFVAASVSTDQDFINDVRSAKTASLNNIVSGVYNPATTPLVNVSSHQTFSNTAYSRIGNVVSVFGQLNVTPSAAGNTSLTMTIPVPSEFNQTRLLSGEFSSNKDGSTTRGVVIANIASKQAEFKFVAPSSAAESFNFRFEYRIV